jgi:hypothetical protein
MPFHIEPPRRRCRPGVARQADEYRAFCLYALGRTREAESIAESIIRREPLARLDAADASPRLEALFADVRKRLLPSLIRDRYRAAKSALEQKSLAVAEPQLAEARLMIVEAERLGVRGRRARGFERPGRRISAADPIVGRATAGTGAGACRSGCDRWPRPLVRPNRHRRLDLGRPRHQRRLCPRWRPPRTFIRSKTRGSLRPL